MNTFSIFQDSFIDSWGSCQRHSRQKTSRLSSLPFETGFNYEDITLKINKLYVHKSIYLYKMALPTIALPCKSQHCACPNVQASCHLSDIFLFFQRHMLKVSCTFFVPVCMYVNHRSVTPSTPLFCASLSLSSTFHSVIKWIAATSTVHHMHVCSCPTCHEREGCTPIVSKYSMVS